MPIRDRYNELIEFRFEALRKVGARFVDDFTKPPARTFLPTVWRASSQPTFPSMTVGPLRIGGVLPSFIIAGELFRQRMTLRVLDIGCAGGSLHKFFRSSYPGIQLQYVGVDVAKPPSIDFPFYSSLSAVPVQHFDLIMLSEVAEHMQADELIDGYLSHFGKYLGNGGAVVLGTPNPLAPAVLHRDVTHVQHYPWYDLYAILRLFFDEVQPLRTHFVTSPRRLITLPLKILLAYFLEVDWCEGLTMVAKRWRQAGHTAPAGQAGSRPNRD